MKVAKNLIEKINSMISDNPPESGGIIGSENFGIIDNVVFDEPNSEEVHYCYYSPNVDFFNKQILTWQDKKVEFMGIFHTHFAGVQSLSDSDKEYITRIMNDMPEDIAFLYFPVFVLPTRVFVAYKAERTKSGIVIRFDDLTIV